MSAPLNRQPNGLLDFFGIKNGGLNPQQLGQIVQPQLDVLSLYENTAPAVVGNTSGAAAAGPVLFGPAGATSEPGASWHFRGVSVLMETPLPADVAYWRLGAYYNGTFVAFTDLNGINGTFTNVANRGALHIRDLWLPPGWSLAYETFLLAGAPNFYAAWWGYRYAW